MTGPGRPVTGLAGLPTGMEPVAVEDGAVILWPAVLGDRVALRTDDSAALEVHVLAVDAVGIYGKAASVDVLEFWPWHVIRGAVALAPPS